MTPGVKLETSAVIRHEIYLMVDDIRCIEHRCDYQKNSLERALFENHFRPIEPLCSENCKLIPLL